MSNDVPGWLSAALAPAGSDAVGNAASLAIATLADERTFGRGGFTLTSAAFDNGAELDPCFTAYEEDAVAPPLEWNAPPPGTQELVLIAEDASSSDGAKCHWLVWGLPPQKGKLLEGETPPRMGKNAQGNSEWLLPQPPIGEAAHGYVFQLFAVDMPLILMPGASRADLLKAIEGRIVSASLLTGTFAGQEDGGEDWPVDGD